MSFSISCVKNDIKPDQVDKIDIGANHSMTTTLYHHRPTTGLQGKFSMEFCISILLLRRKAGLIEYTDAVVQLPEVQAIIPRVNFYVDPEAEEAGFDKMTSIIKIHHEGWPHHHWPRAIRQRQSGESHVLRRSRQQIPRLRRFCQMAQPRKRKRLIEAVKSLERAPDLKNLTAALTA